MYFICINNLCSLMNIFIVSCAFFVYHNCFFFQVLPSLKSASNVRWQPTDPSSSQISIPYKTKKEEYRMLKNVTTDRSIRRSQIITMRKKQVWYYDTAWIENSLLKWKICTSSIKCIDCGKWKSMQDIKEKCTAAYLLYRWSKQTSRQYVSPLDTLETWRIGGIRHCDIPFRVVIESLDMEKHSMDCYCFWHRILKCVQ